MKRRKGIYEKITNYINAQKKVVENGLSVGHTPSGIYLTHCADDEKGQKAERLIIASELVKIGLGYKTTLGKKDKFCEMTLFNLNFKLEGSAFTKRLSERIRRQSVKKPKLSIVNEI